MKNIRLKTNILSVEVESVKEVVGGKYRLLLQVPEYISNEVKNCLKATIEVKDEKDLRIERLEKAIEALSGKKLEDEKIESKESMLDEIEKLTSERPHPNTGYEKLRQKLEEARENKKE